MFYVYQLKYYDDILYIGCGSGNRTDHLLSCISHNPYLNRFASLGYIEDFISITKLHENIPTKGQALVIEKEFIESLNPLFNRTNGGEIFYECMTYKTAKVEHYLEQHMCNRMFDVLKWEKSEPYINEFKKHIAKLEERLDYVLEENERLKKSLKNIKVGVY